MRNIFAEQQHALRAVGGTLWTLCAFMALVAPSIAAPAPASPAQQCLTDLAAFDATMNKDGYWIDGAGHGYGYPVYGYGFSYSSRSAELSGYSRARPGYEVRTLLASARILAQRGAQQSCETVLSTTRDVYANYVTELRAGQLPPADVPNWRRAQIDAALPVALNGTAYRSDQLIGAGIVNAKNENLGTVEDILMSPSTGKIAYLVVGHGGFWGIDEQYSPVPWTDFKSTAGTNMLILPVSKATVDASPQVRKDLFDGNMDFAALGGKVDTYWAAHPPVAMN